MTDAGKDHVDKDCKGEFVELHRIDPEESRPPVGTTVIDAEGQVEFRQRTDNEGNPRFGKKKYTERVIVYYCPDCGAKKEEPWTE
jgi:hypothetical protein